MEEEDKKIVDFDFGSMPKDIVEVGDVATDDEWGADECEADV